MRIAIIGTGYVGLVTGTCLSEAGNDVTCVDIDEQRINDLNRVITDDDAPLPIYEPGLRKLVKRNASPKRNRLRFTTDYKNAVPDAELCFIAVGTPQSHDGAANLDFVRQAAESIGKHMTGPLIVIDKSTVPVGTAVMVEETVRKHTRHDVTVVSNPEFLKEGDAVDDFETPDRVVVGYDSVSPMAKQARLALEQLYKPFVNKHRPLLFMSRESAELTKYAANAMLATRISFINEVANVCERVGADVGDVSKGMGLDRRIGPYFLRPGLGYGGSCFPKDVRAIIHTAAKAGYDFRIVKAVDAVNETQKVRMAEMVLERFGTDLSDHVFAVWGLAFKPETDDLREAPSISIIDRLLQAGASFQVHDPEAAEGFALLAANKWPRDHTRISRAGDEMKALKDADALLLVTEWQHFRKPNWKKVKKHLRKPVVFDGRNLYDPAELTGLGFEYKSIGR